MVTVWGTSKNHAARSVPIPSFLADRLAQICAERSTDDLVFTTWRGKPSRNLNFRRDVFDKAAEDAGLSGLTPHELRHSRVINGLGRCQRQGCAASIRARL